MVLFTVPFNPTKTLPLAAKIAMQAPKSLQFTRLPHGHVKGPKWGAMQRAKLRKQAYAEGRVSEDITSLQQGWNPLWEKDGNFRVPKPYKGHLKARTIDIRVEKIQGKLKEMPSKIEKYRESVRSRRTTEAWTDPITKDFTWNKPYGFILEEKRKMLSKKIR